MMGGNLENVAGYGQLSLGQAVHIAQNSDGGVDQRLAQFLEKRLAEVWAKLNQQPTYILPADEFALLNYYRPRFGDSVIVKDATKRFWDNHKGEYRPPECKYNRVTFNFTVTSTGRQFDRLALMFFGDVEILRTSTAEPTQDGIEWSYVKDMSSLIALFRQSQKIIFDLGNLVDDTYTGSWHTTLTATYFTAEDSLEPADTIVPVSARRSPANRPSHFTVPESRAVEALTIPQNARKAVFSISACGQTAEEFWWSNVLSSDTQAFGNDNTLYGHSPFRELQLLIDGQLAGVAWPFPVIFTGGVVPGFWRPIVGVDAFDLPEDEIDVTPFLPLLTDGKDHEFEIRVVGIDDDGNGHGDITQTIESNWVVTGKLFLWLDTNTSRITGSSPSMHSPRPTISVFSKTTRTLDNTIVSLDYAVQVSRLLHISSTLQTSRGVEKVTWTQNLAYSNHGTLTNNGSDQIVRQNTSGLNTSPASTYSKLVAYPLWVDSSYNVPSDGGLTIDATMRRGKNVEQIGELASHNIWKAVAPRSSTFRGSRITNLQNGTASYISVPALKKSYGSGSTEQHYLLSGVRNGSETTVQHDQLLFKRGLLAVNGSVIVDEQAFGGQQAGAVSHSSTMQEKVQGNKLQGFAIKGIRAMLGRGPQ